MISIIVPWRGRAEISITAPILLSQVEKTGGELIIVNYGGEIPEEIRGIVNSNLVIIDIPFRKYFNKACANNIGAYYASNDIMFFCDTDIILEDNFLEGSIKLLSNREKFFLTLSGVQETALNSRKAGNVTVFGYELFIKIANGRELKIIDNEEDADLGTRQAPGLLLVKKTDFVEVKGYNSRLQGWGWEDQDMIARLTLGAGATRALMGIATHLSHEDAARVEHYPVKDRWETRDRMFRQALQNYDKGNFFGSYDTDVEAL